MLDKDLLSVQEVRTKVAKAHAAWQQFRTFSQAQVDAIVERMAAAGFVGFKLSVVVTCPPPGGNGGGRDRLRQRT